MTQTEGQRLAEFSRAVRESTLKRLRAVPVGFENWSIDHKAMSFADIARHLVDADYWLFDKLSGKDLTPIQGQAGCSNISNREEYEALLIFLEEVAGRRAITLKNIPDELFSTKVHDSRFGGEVSLWWIIVRGNLDHEIHHRGQIAAMLRMLEFI